MRESLQLIIVLLLSLSALAQEPKEITNSIGMKLVLIPKGKFTMGSPEHEEGRMQGEVQHEVDIERDYYLGVHEVTQSQYERVMGTNPSYFQGTLVNGRNADLPVENVSWLEAVEFCKKLSELEEEKKAGRLCRLPTEAEWEYACRAGSTTAYAFDDELMSLSMCGWFCDNSSDRTHTVGLLEPNAWGLHDMHGNVWEWCSEWYEEYPRVGAADLIEGKENLIRIRVHRGGSYSNAKADCRSACRDGVDPKARLRDLGFRVVLNSPDER